MSEAVLNEKYVFEAWMSTGVASPRSDKVIYQVVPEKASQIAALLAGQVDLVAGIPLPEVPASSLPRGWRP